MATSQPARIAHPVQAKPPPVYLAGYPAHLTEPVYQLIEQDRLGEILLKKYPQTHTVRTDKALYDYVLEIKGILGIAPETVSRLLNELMNGESRRKLAVALMGETIWRIFRP